MAIEMGVKIVKVDKKIGRYGGALFKIEEIESTLKDVVDKIKSISGLIKTTDGITLDLEDMQAWFSDVIENESFKEDGFEKEFSEMKGYLEDVILAVEEVRETLEEAL